MEFILWIEYIEVEFLLMVLYVVGSYLVVEWKYSVEVGENEVDECIYIV